MGLGNGKIFTGDSPEEGFGSDKGFWLKGDFFDGNFPAFMHEMKRAVEPLFHGNARGLDLVRDLIELGLVSYGEVIAQNPLLFRGEDAFELEILGNRPVEIGLIGGRDFKAAVVFRKVALQEHVGVF